MTHNAFYSQDYFQLLDTLLGERLYTKQTCACNETLTNDKYVLEFELPGVKREDLKLTHSSSGILSLRAKRGKQDIERDYRLRGHEKIDWERPNAKLQDGILTLTFNLLGSAKPKEIPIE